MCKKYIEEMCVFFDKMTEEDNSGATYPSDNPTMLKYGLFLDDLINEARKDESLSREDIVMLINHLPYGLIMDDFGSATVDIICDSGHFPIRELWFAKTFSESLLDLKLSALDKREFDLTEENGIVFSFTPKIITKHIQLIGLLDLAKNFTDCDIDNILTILSIMNIENSENNFSEEFDNELVRCIKFNGYNFKYGNNDNWRSFSNESFENLNLRALNSYLKSIS